VSRAKPSFFDLAVRLSALVLVAAGPALAQENQPSGADSATGWLFRWINFAIILALIVYAFRKAGPSFRSHKEEISQQIQEGARAREAAERDLHEVQVKMAGIDSLTAEMRVEAKRAAEAEGQRLRELAKTEAGMIEQATKAEITAAERAARMELRVFAARKAVERAEGTLQGKITSTAEAVLFGTFVAELQRSAN
jgi:F0F1-type ATP synthase membrane subunit b/b'